MLPCHLIAGPLGAGKSTAILEFVRARAGDERIAVLTNDFGRTGLDAEIIRGDGAGVMPALRVENIPGGCLCCSSMGDFRGALKAVSEDEALTRVIIEPSGLAILSDFIPYLKELCDAFGMQLAPVMVILNPKRVKQPHYEQLPFFADLVDHADVLVGNRMDQCDEAERTHFSEWTHALQPSKRMIVETSFGRLPQAAFSTDTEADPGTYDGFKFLSSASTRVHTHPEYSGGFREAWSGEISSVRFRRQLENWSTGGIAGGAVLRLKALLPTEKGWELFEIADDLVYQRVVPKADGVRVDWITEKPVNTERVREALRDCAEGA